MKYEDLSEWDINLIKDGAIRILSSQYVCRYHALAESVLRCIHAKGFNVIHKSKNLPKDIATEITPQSGYNSTRNPTANEVIVDVFTYFSEHKIDIIRDDSRKATWSTPNESWYTKSDNKKKPWVI